MSPLASPPPVLAPPLLPARRVRSAFVTVLAWCMVAVSAVTCLVSLAALLMVVAGSQGTAHASLSGGLVVMGLPPVTLIAGIGLLRRWRWSYAYVLVLLGSVAVWNISQMLRGPTPQQTYTSPGGVPTTVLASPVNYPAHVVVVAVSLGLLGGLLRRSTRAECWPMARMSTVARTTPRGTHSTGASEGASPR